MAAAAVVAVAAAAVVAMAQWISTIAYMSVLMMVAALHVHRQYGHVRLWRKSLGGVSLSPRGIRQICRFAPETHRKRITAVSPTSTDRNTTTVRLFFFFRYAVLLQDVEDYELLRAWVFTKIFT